MRQNLGELLASAVSSTYGTFYGTVVSALAMRSRTTSSELIRALPKLSSSDVRLALVTLVQQHLVNHHTDESGITYYEPSWDNAYNFTCRLPTLHKFMEERFGSNIAQVFDSVAHAGVVNVGDLIAETNPLPSTNLAENLAGDGAEKHSALNGKIRTNGGAITNGIGAHEPPSELQKELYGALNLLLSLGYIMRVNERQFWAPHDRETEAINETILDKFPAGTSAKKERDALQDESTKLLRRWRDEDDNFVPPTISNGAKNGRKRAHSPDFPEFEDDFKARTHKRHQLNDKLPAAATRQYQSWLSDHQDSLDHELVLAVNFDKCVVGLRTQHFVQYCERYVHATTAKVYEALLRVLENHTPRCYDLLQRRPEVERDFFAPVYEKPHKIDIGLSEPVSTRDIAKMLDPTIDLDEGLAPEPDDDIAPSIETTNGVNGNGSRSHNDEDANNARLRKIEQHLQNLVSDPRGLVQTSHREWLVPFHSISQRLIEAEIENTVTHTLGMLPARMLRILKYYGHQEIRHLALKAMVTEDTARTACQHLHQAGWIDIAELPRTARREVTKSLWLWSYDVLKAREKCLADCYFAMSRLSIHLQKEREKIDPVINKSERSDVKGNEDKYLNTEEKTALAKYSRQSDLVTRQMIRIDDVVAVMRDFTKMEYPHKIWDQGWIEWHSPSREPSDDDKRAIEEFETGREAEGVDDGFDVDDEDEDNFIEPE